MELVEKQILTHGIIMRYSIKAVTQTNITPPLVIAGLVTCQFRTDVNIISPMDHRISVSVKSTTLYDDKVLTPKIRVQCYGVNTVTKEDLNQQVLQQIADDSMMVPRTDSWQLKGTVSAKTPAKRYHIVFRLFLQLVYHKSNFQGLHDDTELTDFELCGTNGSVHVHKAVLATSSEVLKGMLSGQWRESAKGKVDMVGVTQETLEMFKDYLYLHKLPNKSLKSKDRERSGGPANYNDRLEELLKLACYLMMPDLIQACTTMFLMNLNTQNAFQLLSLAGTYKLKNLMKGILLSFKDGSIELDNGPSCDTWM